MPLRRKLPATPVAGAQDESAVPVLAPDRAANIEAKLDTIIEAVDPKPPPVAHIITKQQLAAAKRGDKVKSLCGGATIKGDPKVNAPVCQACVLEQMRVDDRKTDDQLRTRYNDGVTEGERRGIRQGEQNAMRQIREAAEQRAPAMAK